ncbi:MAG: type II toxin-antitoxin system HicB family antitoxin [Euryarchaeota archaeon]|nr:type II toxin-antitoxin system HicB family antitoxin [Euryarchaeota archaeon]
MYKYTIIVEKADNNYSAYCPDLPGCIATGATVEETVARMKEAIEFHLEGMKEEGLSVPKPTTVVRSIEVAVEG